MNQMQEKVIMKKSDRVKHRIQSQIAGLGGKGLQTRQIIIEIARKTLIDQGYEKFVIRQIAKDAGIKPGNLQYYFKNKRDLLAAVLMIEIRRYEDAYTKVAESRLGLKETITAAFNFLLQEIGTKSTANIWYVVWSVAQHDDDIAALMSDWYATYTNTLKNLFLQSSETLSDKRAGHIAAITTAVIDGLMVQIGYGKRSVDIHADIEKTCVDMLHFLAAE